MMKYVNYLSFLFCVVLVFNLKAQNQRPNILFVLADDASYQHFGAYGCDWIKTPGFDKVAHKGILFNNAYTPNAKCSPSRSCIVTGLNSWQLEDAGNHFSTFPTKFSSYVEVLSQNGYDVGYTGKGWSPGKPMTEDGKKRELTGKAYNQIKLTPPTKEISNIDYAKNFEVFMNKKSKTKPFCFWYGAKEPHRRYEFNTGVTVGGKDVNSVKNIPAFWPDVKDVRIDMLDYALEVEHFDQHLDKILNTLEESGDLGNTLVVVTSDNGMPFPRVKGQVYEMSNHLPLAVMWGKGIKSPGRKIDDFVSFVDFMPTFLEIAGVKNKENQMNELPGKSLVDIFKTSKAGKVSCKRDFVLVGKERHDVGRPNDEGYPVRGIVQGDYLYLHNYEIERWPGGNPETGYRNCDSSPTKTTILNMNRKGDSHYWNLSFGKRVSEELYDIKKDPYCVDNLLAVTNNEFLLIKESMKKQMESSLKKQKDPRMFGNGTVFDNYPYANAKARNYYNRVMSGEKITTGIQPSDVDKDITK